MNLSQTFNNESWKAGKLTLLSLYPYIFKMELFNEFIDQVSNIRSCQWSILFLISLCIEHREFSTIKLFVIALFSILSLKNKDVYLSHLKERFKMMLLLRRRLSYSQNIWKPMEKWLYIQSFVSFLLFSFKCLSPSYCVIFIQACMGGIYNKTKLGITYPLAHNQGSIVLIFTGCQSF